MPTETPGTTIRSSESIVGDDRSLLQRYRRGDDDAATELYQRYAERLQRLATSETSDQLRSQVDPDDLVQSVFRTFFRRASAGYYDVPEGDEIWGLFLVIALNKIRYRGRYHTRKKRDVRLTQSLPPQSTQQIESDNVPFAALQLTISELLTSIPKLHQQMVEMRIQGHELQEIAETTSRSSRTVERVLKQFRDRLSRELHGV